MSAVKALCQKIDRVFFKVLTKPSMAATYLLADLYRYQATAKGEDKKNIYATLRKLKLQPDQIKTLWRSISSMPSSNWKVLDPETQKSLNMLKRAMLQDTVYLQALELSDLLSLGKSVIWYRDVLIALIRKHQLLRHGTDPFTSRDFSYRIVRQGGSEQNYLYVSRYIARCHSLPIKEIITLGSHQSKVAELILKDLTNSHSYFPVSAGYAKRHASLRSVIAKDWQRYLEVYPLHAEDRDYLERELPLLQAHYPEFRRVQIDNRVTRHYQEEPAIKWQSGITRITRSRHIVVVLPPSPVALFQFTLQRSHKLINALSTSSTPANKPFPKPKITGRFRGLFRAC